MTDQKTPEVSTFERVLAFMLLAIVLLSVGCFIAVMIGSGTGMGGDDFAGGVWPAVTILPLIGLPLAFVMLIVLIVISAARRSRQNRG